MTRVTDTEGIGTIKVVAPDGTDPLGLWVEVASPGTGERSWMRVPLPTFAVRWQIATGLVRVAVHVLLGRPG